MTARDLLNAKNLQVHFHVDDKIHKIVNGVTLCVERGETLGITGESGSGKSVLAHSLINLVDPSGEIVGGEVWFNDRDLLKLDDKQLNRIRGEEIGLIPQNPTASHDPLMFIGLQSGEVLEEHRKAKREKIRQQVIKYLGKASVPDPGKSYVSYAHEFSEGMNQRILIAASLLCAPSLLIADEPTASLDMTIQRQILELLKEMKRSFGLSMVYITHDLGVIAEMSDRVAVMYAGKVVECADVYSIFDNPLHPYTKGLLASYLPLRKRIKLGDIEPIPGIPPNGSFRPDYCSFAPRCKYATPLCHQKIPLTTEVNPGHFVQCLQVDSIE
ncbi:MAG: ABC transporter ATP-binding protein [Candidatus Methanofastidiosia archaeon]|jgi:peptide/nickel transport system ATP-binding protein/oligopeptide transport system ATP-binding protein